MDTTDPDIVFDEAGVCNHCRRFDMLARTVLAASESPGRLESLADKIRQSGPDRSMTASWHQWRSR